MKRLEFQERPIGEALATPRGGRELWAWAIGVVLLLGVAEMYVARAIARQST
jgi:hypothetical protein